MKEQTKADRILKSVRRVHMIGIGGAGMAPLAEILFAKGYTLTGSDNNESDTLERMRETGIPVALGHDPKNIEGAELVVHSAAIMKDNPELAAAEEKGIPVYERSFLLGMVSRNHDNVIAVSGTHGKTTTTAMLTQILMEAGLDPSAVIGGKLPSIGGNGRAGETGLLVVEACEYRDTFLQVSPETAVILNIDADHLEYFKTMDNLKKSFRTFAESATRMVVANGDDQNTMETLKDMGKPVVTFGFGPQNDYTAADVEVLPRAETRFRLMKQGEEVCKITLHVPGRHNVFNALAAAAAALETGAAADKIVSALLDFRGAGRRFEILGKPDGVTIADDYAHHPAELKVTLEAAKSMGFKKVYAVFQPFTYSRTAMLMDDFAEVLKIADQVVLSEIMGSREINTYNVYTSDLCEKIPGAVWFPSFPEIADYIVEHATAGDLVITLGCGDIYKAAKIMLKKYKSR